MTIVEVSYQPKLLYDKRTERVALAGQGKVANDSFGHSNIPMLPLLMSFTVELHDL